MQDDGCSVDGGKPDERVLELLAGLGGQDDIGGVHYQIVKPAYGALDSQTIVSTANPLPARIPAVSMKG